MMARASKVLPRPTLSAMMQPPSRSSLSIAPMTPSLELVQLFPDSRVADAGGGFDDAFFVQLVPEVPEDVEEGQVVDQRWGFRIGEFLEPRKECGLLLIGGRQRIPQACEPRA